MRSGNQNLEHSSDSDSTERIGPGKRAYGNSGITKQLFISDIYLALAHGNRSIITREKDPYPCE
jgi:hypothetical protein